MIGDLREDKNSKPTGDLYAIATLDGLLILVKKDSILW